MFKITLIIGAVCLLSTGALAQTNNTVYHSVISHLTDYVESDSKSLAEASCSPDALRVTRQSFKSFVAGKVNDVTNIANQGNHLRASGKAAAARKAIAYCFSDMGSPHSELDHVSSAFARFLTIEAQYGSKYGATDQIKISRASDFTAYAKQAGLDMSDIERALDKLKPKEKVAVSRGEDSTVHDASKIAQEVENNAIRFKRDYVNKTITVKGIVNKIKPGFRSGIDVIFKSPPAAEQDPEDKLEGYVEHVNPVICRIAEGSTFEDKAIDLNKGDTVTVKGMMELLTGTTPQLIECEIL